MFTLGGAETLRETRKEELGSRNTVTEARMLLVGRPVDWTRLRRGIDGRYVNRNSSPEKQGEHI